MLVSSVRSASIKPKHLFALVISFVIIGGAPFVLTPYTLLLLALGMAYGLFAFGLDLAWGRAGIVSIGHASFFGLGAYGVAIAMNSDLSGILGGVAGIAAAALLALVVGLAGLGRRSTASTMAVLTLALTLLMEQVMQSSGSVTNGSNGLFVASLPLITGYYTSACLVVVAVFITWVFVIRGRLGQQALAVRSNPERAEHLGINPARVRLLMFILSAMVSALAGVIAAPYISLVSPQTAGILLSTQVLVWLAVGGLGTIGGAFLGAGLITIGEQYLGEAVGQWYLLILGIIFVLTVRFAPLGLVGLLRDAPWGARMKHLLKGSEVTCAPVVKARSLKDDDLGTPILKISQAVKRFGGRPVIEGLDLEVMKGELVCLIGPNGAGKTTLLNMLAGDLEMDGGTVCCFGRDVTSWPPYQRARLGLGRLFQIPSLFLGLSPAENLALAEIEGGSHIELPTSYGAFGERSQILASELSLADRRGLEMAVVFAGSPDVVLLDEPAAGIGHDDSMKLARTLRSVAEQTGCTMIVVEHDMKMVREMAHRVVVLVGGRLMFDGSMEDAANHPDVRQAYLGASV